MSASRIGADSLCVMWPEDCLEAHDDWAVFVRIAEGVGERAGRVGGCPGGLLSEAEVWGVVAFIRPWTD